MSASRKRNNVFRLSDLSMRSEEQLANTCMNLYNSTTFRQHIN